jgi:hypothetical protein
MRRKKGKHARNPAANLPTKMKMIKRKLSKRFPSNRTIKSHNMILNLITVNLRFVFLDHHLTQR